MYENYNILYTVSGMMFNQTMVCMLSAIHNCKKPINFYIMQCEWTDEQKKGIKEFIRSYSPNTVTIVDVDENDFKAFKPYKGSYSVYYKLMAHKYISAENGLTDIDRILYLDVDTIILKDIERYYSEDSDGNYFYMAVHPNMVTYKYSDYDKRTDKGKWPNYAVCGSIVIYCSELRKDNVDVNAFSGFANDVNLDIVDESLINMVFWGKIKFFAYYKFNYFLLYHDKYRLAYEYNTQERLERCNAVYYEKFDEDEFASIVHFASGHIPKPWNVVLDEKNKKVIGFDSKGFPDFFEYYRMWWEYASELPSKYFKKLVEAAYEFAICNPIKRQNIALRNENNNFKSVANGDISVGDLKKVTDISLYLDRLFDIRDRYMIALSVRDTPGGKLSEKVVEKIHNLGFANFKIDLWRMYAGIIFKGKVLLDESPEKAEEPVIFTDESEIADERISISSLSYRRGNRSDIIIGNVNYSTNIRGINIVVYDTDKRCCIDSIGFDGYFEKQIFTRKPEFDVELTRRFYFPEKYKSIWYDYFAKKYYSDRPLKVDEVENGIILPVKGNQGGVCDSSFNFIAGYVSNPETQSSGAICRSYVVDENDLEYVDETVVFGGTMFDHLGHMILDGLPQRMWWYVRNPDSKLKCAILVVWDHGGAKCVKEYLDLFGMPEDRIIFVTKPTKFKKIIVPEQSLYMRGVANGPVSLSKEYAAVWEHIRKGLKGTEHKKVYFTRRKSFKQDLIGEEFFIDFYRSKGFTIVDPEDHTLREKAELLFGADEFVSQIGTNTMYCIFCKPTVKMVLLSRINDSLYHTDSQALVIEAMGIRNFYCVDVCLNFIHKNFVWGTNLMGVTESFTSYVMDTYNEPLNTTQEDSLRTYLYPYLKRTAEYYSARNPWGVFNRVKNQKMLTVFEMMSEVFLGKDFDSSGLDLTTNEDILNKQIVQLTADLNKSKKCISELENSDVYKAAKSLEVTVGYIEKANAELSSTNSRLEDQIIELQSALKEVPSYQSKIDELSKKNSEMMKSILNSKHALELQERDSQLKEELLQDNLRKSEEANDKLTVQLEEIKNKLSKENSELVKSVDFFKHELELHRRDSQLREERLQKQIDDYEQSRSWRITKPLRSIAWFLRRLFGKSE